MIVHLMHLVLTQDKFVFPIPVILREHFTCAQEPLCMEVPQVISVFVMEMKRGRTGMRHCLWPVKKQWYASSESSREHLVDPAGLLCPARMEQLILWLSLLCLFRNDSLDSCYLYRYAAEFSYLTDLTHSFSVDISKLIRSLQSGEKKGMNNILEKSLQFQTKSSAQLKRYFIFVCFCDNLGFCNEAQQVGRFCTGFKRKCSTVQ